MSEEYTIQECLDELIPSEETEDVSYGFCIPLKNTGMAWLHGVPQDVYIEIRTEGDGIWYSQGFFGTDRYEKMVEYLNEIKSGVGNWIISPGKSSFGIDWDELDYENASVIKRVSKIVSEHSYEKVN